MYTHTNTFTHTHTHIHIHTRTHTHTHTPAQPAAAYAMSNSTRLNGNTNHDYAVEHELRLSGLRLSLADIKLNVTQSATRVDVDGDAPPLKLGLWRRYNCNRQRTAGTQWHSPSSYKRAH